MERSTNKSGFNILIVEDNPLSLKLLTILTKKWGFNYQVSTTGKQALDLVNRYEFDVILMDFQLPDMNGFEVMESLEAQGKSGDVIYLTGMDELVHHNINMLLKPYQPQVLKSRIDEFRMRQLAA